ncbi:hypothetical protein, partial [Kocuria sabuli]|uniref:hypothetical protein n=1 Tax=Kocuria sabuli TaxID=3071448 RepID=UPI0034D7776D
VRAEQVLSYLPLVGVATVVLMLAVVGARVVLTRRRAAQRPVGTATTADAAQGRTRAAGAPEDGPKRTGTGPDPLPAPTRR